MYNKGKRVVSIISGALSIAIGSFSALCALMNLTALSATDPSAIVLSMFDTAFAVLIIVFGTKFLRMPQQVNGVYDERKGAHIALIVIYSIYFIYAIVGASFCIVNLEMIDATPSYPSYDYYYYSMYSENEFFLTYMLYIYNVVFAAAGFALNIVTMRLKTYKAAPSGGYGYTAHQQYARGNEDLSGVSAKVMQLKQLKDEGIITEEEYNEAISKLISQI